MDQLTRSAQKIGAALRHAANVVTLADIKPGSPLPMPLSEKERDDRVTRLCATVGFDKMEWKEIWPLVRPRLVEEEPPIDSDEWLMMWAAEIANNWRELGHTELFHVWHWGNNPAPWYGDIDFADERRKLLYDVFAWLDENAGTSYYAESAKRFAAWLTCGRGRWNDPQFIESLLRKFRQAADDEGIAEELRIPWRASLKPDGAAKADQRRPVEPIEQKKAAPAIPTARERLNWGKE